MTLNYVTLTLDLVDGSGNKITSGYATFTPSAELTGGGLISQAPIGATFRSTGSSPTVSLLATDNGAVSPAGWAWTVTFTEVPGSPSPFSFFLPFAGGASQNLSAQAPVSSVTTMQAYLPLPVGIATAGYVPVATGTGEVSTWSPPAGLQLQAGTGVTGYTMVNNTGTIISWTAPNDGALHRALVYATLYVSSAETGGQVNLNFMAPGAAGVSTINFVGASKGTGVQVPSPNSFFVPVQAGTTVSITQFTALTAGASVLYTEIWGS